GSARDHKEGRGDQGPKREANGFLARNCSQGRLRKVSGCGSCRQFLWLPPQATPSPHRVSLDLLSRFPGNSDSRAFSAKLVRNCEITANFQRCKNIFKK